MKLENAGRVTRLALSPEGNYIATASATTIAVWSTRTSQLVGSRDVHGVRGLNFSPDGFKLAVTTSSEGRHQVVVFPWRLDGVIGQADILSPSHCRPVFSQCNTALAVGQSLIDGRLKGGKIASDGRFTGPLAFSPTASEFVAVNGGDLLVIAKYWPEDSEAGLDQVMGRQAVCHEESYTLDEAGYIHPIQALAFSPNGEAIALGAPNKVAFVSAQTAELLNDWISLSGLFGNSELVRQDVAKIVFAPDGRKLAVVSNVCSSQLPSNFDGRKARRRGGVCISDPPWRNAPRVLTAASSRLMYFADAIIVGNELVVAGLDLAREASPFLLRYDI